MTQKEKQLLLIDLCSRLPYGVIVQVKDWTTLDAELKTGHIRLLQEDKIELKPYLRPMSEIANLITAKEYSSFGGVKLIDWYNANHIDYRGLIDKGLAIKVTEENNPYED